METSNKFDIFRAYEFTVVIPGFASFYQTFTTVNLLNSMVYSTSILYTLYIFRLLNDQCVHYLAVLLYTTLPAGRAKELYTASQLMSMLALLSPPTPGGCRIFKGFHDDSECATRLLYDSFELVILHQ